MSELDPVTVAVQQIRPAEAGTTLEYVIAQLSDDQVTALEEMKAGKSIKAAAATIGMDRSTVFRWIANDPYFKAAHNAWKQEARESARGQINALLDIAVSNVEKALASGDAKLSYKLLKDLGFLARQKDSATDPALVRQQIAVELGQQSPLSDPRTLTALLTEAGLSPTQQRRLLIGALRPLQADQPGAV